MNVYIGIKKSYNLIWIKSIKERAVKIAFVSDFDNTITRKDFYWLVTEKYLGQDGFNLYCKWQNRKMTVFDYLGCVFGNLNQSEDVLREDILSIPVDPAAVDFINKVAEMGWDFYIVSAGCSYYLDIILEKYSLRDKVKVYSNPGFFQDGNIIMSPNMEFLSLEYGIDKGKIVERVKEKSDIVFFAGDSAPDYNAGLKADYRFARLGEQLAGLFDTAKIDYFPFEDFSQISEIALDIAKNAKS